jgi:hypothetical protein
MRVSEDARGYTITTASDTAGEACRMAIENFIERKVNVMPHLKAAIKADPDCGMARAANGLILHGVRNVNFRPMIRASMWLWQNTETRSEARDLFAPVWNGLPPGCTLHVAS